MEPVGVANDSGLLSLNASLVFYCSGFLFTYGFGFYLYSGKGEKYP